MGCCGSGLKRSVRWQEVDETPADNQFTNTHAVDNLTNREWKPKVISKKSRYALPAGSLCVRILDDEEECYVSGAAVMPNGDIFIVDQANKKLKSFDKKTYRFKVSSQVPSVPESVCSVPDNNHVYVTFPNSCRIRQIAVTDNDMQRINTIQTVSKCTAISSNRYGGLAVAINTVGNNWQIHLMNSKGQVQKKVHTESLLLNPEHIVVTKEMNLVISDRGNHSVFHITPDGYVIFAYKELKLPLAVLTDKNGYIYVAGPEKVHQLNERGEMVNYVLSKADIGFVPMTMTYRAKDEVMLVAGKCDKLKVYTLK